MTALLWRLADMLALAAGAILFAIVAVTSTNVGAFLLDRLARPLGGSVAGLPGYEDFVQLAVSAAALMVFPWCQAQRGHVAVDLVVARAPRALQRGLDRAWLVLTAAVALFLAWWMGLGLLEAQADGRITSVLGWPVWPFYMPGIAAMLLCAAIALAQIGAAPGHE